MAETTFQFAPISPVNGYHDDNYWLWCPSITQGPDGTWHLFVSRWPKTLPFHPGWLVASEVIRATSDRPEGPYEFAEVVLAKRGAQYWDGRSTHNPSIRCHDGKYYLYYMGSTHPLEEADHTLTTQSAQCIVARSMKRIGVAWADRPEGPWTRMDQPILTTQPNSFYSFLTSNPAPHIHSNGEVTLLFKAREYEGNTHGSMSIGIAKADSPLGTYQVVKDTPIFSTDLFGEIEDPFLWMESDGFHMIAKDMSGELSGQAGAGIHAQSPDAQSWTLSNPTTAYKRTIEYNDGTSRDVGSLERPFLHIENGQSKFLAAAVSNGTINFTDATKSWIHVIPLMNT
ncbi:glycoside hydrolase family protein [Coraliomargarita algicola]|uniref:Glycoside hydrolase family protein n=1 Tax=Coraliomargarita algicola TaxID=3092156 RepID=A0ABZ0RNF4_9BACT|nr:glycoside hydrolase family protein [Coraliomargarita sp. J2-16]WPJ96290.1 glycoside hydrolase family protein [Coraliomargarita sp. J2-16]